MGDWLTAASSVAMLRAAELIETLSLGASLGAGSDLLGDFRTK